MCLLQPDVHSEDYYQVLGVKRAAADKDISAAYKRLALKYHPDKNPNSREQAELVFKRITHAYEVLREPVKRNAYDTSRNYHSCASVDSSGNGIPGDYGSFERADDLYRRFFGGDLGGNASMPNINIAGLFNFDQKPQAKPSAKGPGKSYVKAHLIPLGMPVAIHGLASKPELNGKSATVREWSAAKSRYVVTLNCGGVLSLRPTNLTQLCHVKVTGHENQPEVNGKTGEIVDFNEETRSYVLLLEDPALVVELPPKNCICASGTAGVLDGLRDEQLGGKMCSIVSVDHNAQRYVVQCEDGRQLKVRFENFMC